MKEKEKEKGIYLKQNLQKLKIIHECTKKTKAAPKRLLVFIR